MIKEVVRPFQLLGCNRIYIRLAGVSGAAATILGAMGAHRTYAPENAVELKRLFETANRYHFYSTVALLGVPFTRMPLLVRRSAPSFLDSPSNSSPFSPEHCWSRAPSSSAAPCTTGPSPTTRRTNWIALFPLAASSSSPPGWQWSCDRCILSLLPYLHPIDQLNKL